jgi:hypothetical protein
VVFTVTLSQSTPTPPLCEVVPVFMVIIGDSYSEIALLFITEHFHPSSEVVFTVVTESTLFYEAVFSIKYAYLVIGIKKIMLRLCSTVALLHNRLSLLFRLFKKN